MTDLYDTEGEGEGDFAGSRFFFFLFFFLFFARPVVGAHFRWVALDRACDGKAAAGLQFLDGEESGGEGEGWPASARQQGAL